MESFLSPNKECKLDPEEFLRTCPENLILVRLPGVMAEDQMIKVTSTVADRYGAMFGYQRASEVFSLMAKEMSVIAEEIIQKELLGA
jgi:hypothetical protein